MNQSSQGSAISNTDVPPGWEGLLDPGERVIWQGRPVPGLTFQPVQPMQIIMGFFFMGFSTFWMTMVSSITENMGGPVKLFPLFGLLFFGIGAWNAGLYAIWRAWVRQHVIYTLTNQRAFVACNMPVAGKKLSSWPITTDSRLELVGDAPGTIWFADKRISTQKGSYKQQVGFVRIPDARKVYALMRSIQRGEA